MGNRGWDDDDGGGVVVVIAPARRICGEVIHVLVVATIFFVCCANIVALAVTRNLVSELYDCLLIILIVSLSSSL